jgi:hypothetical protein
LKSRNHWRDESSSESAASAMILTNYEIEIVIRVEPNVFESL